MKEILSSPLLVDSLLASGKECEHNPDLYYDFVNEVHWPLFLAFFKTHRGIDYDSLDELEQVDVCIDSDLLTKFVKETPRFHRFRSRYYFYQLSLADVTDIDLFELSDTEVIDMLNLRISQAGENSKPIPFLKRLFRRGTANHRG
jgi:hypothetical protein